MSELQNYEIDLKKIGKGSFCKVYKAIDKKTQTPVALKVINKSKMEPHILQKILTEITLILDLDHPNIIKYITHFSDSHYVYIVLEYCSGSLKPYIEKSLSQSEVKKIMCGLKNGLQYLLSKNILHRDLKPDNILIGLDGKIKIADFGLAKHFENPELLKTICGTPVYMCPRLIASHKPHLNSDLWSVGIIFYQLLFGKLPYTVSNISDLISKFNTIVIADIDPTAKDLITRLLNTDPEVRICWDDFFNHPWFNTEKSPQLIHIVTNEITTINSNTLTPSNTLIKEESFNKAELSNSRTFKIGSATIIEDYINIDNSGIRETNTIVKSKFSDSNLYNSGISGYLRSAMSFWA
jgi:serine/threonine protein kinase